MAAHGMHSSMASALPTLAVSSSLRYHLDVVGKLNKDADASHMSSAFADR